MSLGEAMEITRMSRDRNSDRQERTIDYLTRRLSCTWIIDSKKYWWCNGIIRRLSHNIYIMDLIQSYWHAYYFDSNLYAVIISSWTYFLSCSYFSCSWAHLLHFIRWAYHTLWCFRFPLFPTRSNWFRRNSKELVTRDSLRRRRILSTFSPRESII